MAKYDLKRVIVNIVKVSKYETDKYIFEELQALKADLKKINQVRPLTEKIHLRVEKLKKEIQYHRINMRARRRQRYDLNIFVKQYKKDYNTNIQFDDRYNERHHGFRDMIKDAINQAIKMIRASHKLIPSPYKFGKFFASAYGHNKVGWVFAQAGEVLRFYIEKNVKHLYTAKKPELEKKYIGIELEFCAPIEEAAFALKLYKNDIHKFAQLKEDHSLRPLEDLKERGYELAILLEETNYKKSLKKLCDLLKSVGAIAENRRAGLHVHVDMRKRNRDMVFSNLVACQYALLSIVDPKRYNNEFCKVVESRKFPTEFTGGRTERYKTINAAAFYKYKTLEIRMHEGSVDYAQITNWVDLLIKVANYPKKFKNDISKLTILNKRINLNEKVYKYMLDRSCFWQVQNTEETRRMRLDLGDRHEIPRHMRMDNPFLDRTDRTVTVDEELIDNNRIIPRATPPPIPRHVGFMERITEAHAQPEGVEREAAWDRVLAAIQPDFAPVAENLATRIDNDIIEGIDDEE